jgi:uncharacterized membrane protein
MVPVTPAGPTRLGVVACGAASGSPLVVVSSTVVVVVPSGLVVVVVVVVVSALVAALASKPQLQIINIRMLRFLLVFNMASALLLVSGSLSPQVYMVDCIAI